MEIPSKILSRWLALRSTGDAAKIKKLITDEEVSEERINRALRSGKCSDNVFEAMADYYNQKQELVKSYL